MLLRKITLLILALFISITTVYTQTPNSFNYQTVIRDSQGEPITNQDIGLKFNILQGSTDGQVVYSETHSVSTNDFGLANLQIGNGNTESGSISNISWDSDQYYLEVQVDKEGGANYQTMGTSQLVSVPYALQAKKADLNQHSITDLSDVPSFSADKWMKVNSTGDGIELVDSPEGGDISDNTTDDLSEGSDNLYFTDSRAVSAINNDGDHGSDASHDYFSGDYSDLSNTPSDVTDLSDYTTDDLSEGSDNLYFTDSRAVSAINNDGDHGSDASHDYFSGDFNDLSNKPSPTLDDILDNGNSAGNNYIEMNGNGIEGLSHLTINKGNNSDLWLKNGADINFFKDGDRVGSITQTQTSINTNVEYFLWWSKDQNEYFGSITSDGLEVTGDIEADGSKNFVEEHPENSNKEIVYAADEGPEVATYIRDTVALTNGEATIEFPEHYSLVTEEEGLTAQLTPAGDCNGLYVEELTKDKLVVKELNDGSSNVEFYYLVHGIRKGYEDHKVIREKRDENASKSGE